jgi:glycosyltransferase involved in cell wall biosynthesis
MILRAAAIIPAYNEAAAIATVIQGVRDLVATTFVIDDGSTDTTAELARAAGADVIEQPENLGKGAAIRAGLARVLEADFSHVLLLDGDMQHLPHEASRLIEAAASTGADAVLGERQFRRDEMPASRYHTNRIGSWALSSFVGVPIRDTQCGFRVFAVPVLRDLPLKAKSYDIETEMLIKVRRRGGHIVGVPVTAVYAGQRSKLRPIRDTTRTCFLAVYYRYLERL